MHPFEKSGLGVAPFRFVGMHTEVGPMKLADGTEVGAPGQAMGTCAFCGTGIKDCCTIQDKNGERFIVGTTCVLKTSDRRLISTVKDELKKANLEKRHVREAARIDAIRGQMKDAKIRATLAAIPHPIDWRAEKGETMLDSCEWMINNAGTRGRLSVGVTIKRHAKRT